MTDISALQAPDLPELEEGSLSDTAGTAELSVLHRVSSVSGARTETL